MLSSRGEIKIHEVLKLAGLPFKEEYIFDDLLASSGRPLRFDFAVFDDFGDIDFLIEFQGEQHPSITSLNLSLEGRRDYFSRSIMIIKRKSIAPYII